MNILRKRNKEIINQEVNFNISLEGKKVRTIDLSETTANNQFCEVTLEEDRKGYIVRLDKVMDKIYTEFNEECTSLSFNEWFIQGGC